MVLNRGHLAEFAAVLAKARKITILTGAGVSAESGVPTFRDEGGLWRTYSATLLWSHLSNDCHICPRLYPGSNFGSGGVATSTGTGNTSSICGKSVPCLGVLPLPEGDSWNLEGNRCIVSKVLPNAAHYALTALEQRCKQDAKKFALLTQNIDELHTRANGENVIELHGSLWKTRCTHCEHVHDNHDMPICKALDGRGAPDPATLDTRIPPMELPRCKLCNGLLRPHVVWFGENLSRQTLNQVDDALQGCDLLVVAGTSAVVWPAAGYAPLVSALGGTVAEFNIESTPASRSCQFRFQGPSASTLPEALGISQDELKQAPRS